VRAHQLQSSRSLAEARVEADRVPRNGWFRRCDPFISGASSRSCFKVDLMSVD
jgi:hypothetical protein